MLIILPFPPFFSSPKDPKTRNIPSNITFPRQKIRSQITSYKRSFESVPKVQNKMVLAKKMIKPPSKS